MTSNLVLPSLLTPVALGSTRVYNIRILSGPTCADPTCAGSWTPLDRLNDLLCLARSNSVDGDGACVAPSDSSGPALPTSASMFSSAFSPSHRRLGGRLPPVSEPRDGSTAGVLGEVDRMLDAMF